MLIFIKVIRGGFNIGMRFAPVMPKVNINQAHPFHIMARSNSGHWLYLSTEQVWSALLEQWSTHYQ